MVQFGTLGTEFMFEGPFSANSKASIILIVPVASAGFQPILQCSSKLCKPSLYHCQYSCIQRISVIINETRRIPGFGAVILDGLINLDGVTFCLLGLWQGQFEDAVLEFRTGLFYIHLRWQ